MMDEPKVKDPNHPSGPVAVRNLKVWVERDLCIGAATCVAVAPYTFNLDSDAKAIILETAQQELDETIIEAAKACPTAAIFIEDEKGQRIYPK